MPDENLPDKAHRLVSLDPRDVEDLSRLLGKLREQPETKQEHGGAPGSKASGLEQRAQRMLEERQRRAAIFGPQMFAEPAWDMLLILYAGGNSRRQTQGSLGDLAGASKSTAMRWIDFLIARKLVQRQEHPTDKRLNFVSLTETGRGLLELYLSETGSLQAPE